jgi:hypothetical protein
MRSVSQGSTLGIADPFPRVQLLDTHLNFEAAIRATRVSTSISNSWFPKVA